MAEKKDGFESKVLDSLSKISEKLVAHDNRFDKLENNIKRDLKDFMLTHFDKIYGILEKLQQEFKLLNSAVKRLEDRMDRFEKIYREEIDSVKKQVMDLLSRIEKLEAKVGVQ